MNQRRLFGPVITSRLSIVIAAVTALLFAAVGFHALGEQHFRPKRVISARFEPITKFETKTTQQVGSQLNPDELVLGVTVEGEARAYPINMLTGPSREIINDHLGNKAIAATW